MFDPAITGRLWAACNRVLSPEENRMWWLAYQANFPHVKGTQLETLVFGEATYLMTYGDPDADFKSLELVNVDTDEQFGQVAVRREAMKFAVGWKVVAPGSSKSVLIDCNPRDSAANFRWWSRPITPTSMFGLIQRGFGLDKAAHNFHRDSSKMAPPSLVIAEAIDVVNPHVIAALDNSFTKGGGAWLGASDNRPSLFRTWVALAAGQGLALYTGPNECPEHFGHPAIRKLPPDFRSPAIPLNAQSGTVGERDGIVSYCNYAVAHPVFVALTEAILLRPTQISPDLALRVEARDLGLLELHKLAAEEIERLWAPFQEISAEHLRTNSAQVTRRSHDWRSYPEIPDDRPATFDEVLDILYSDMHYELRNLELLVQDLERTGDRRAPTLRRFIAYEAAGLTQRAGIVVNDFNKAVEFTGQVSSASHQVLAREATRSLA